MTNESKQKREKVTLTLDQHPDFQVTNDGSLKTSSDLCKIINGLFKEVFADYIGCRVYVDINANPAEAMNPLSQAHPVQVELYFTMGTHDSSDKIIAFKSITQNIRDEYAKPADGGKVMNYVQATLGYNAQLQTNKSCQITQEGIDILGSLLWKELAVKMGPNPTPAAFTANNIVVESHTDSNASPYMTPSTQITVYNVVRCIDINSLLDLIYSRKDESKKYYNTVPIKPIQSTINQNAIYGTPQTADQRWLFMVNRIDQKNFQDKCNELGGFNVGGGLNINMEV